MKSPDYLLPDTVWERVRPLLPPERPKPKGGRPRMDDRKALNAIFYILRTGCQWKALPIVIAGANRHDMKLTEATLEAQQIVPCDLEPGEHRHPCLDKGYDYAMIREVVKAWGYEAHIPPRDESQRMIRDIPLYRARR